MQERLPYNLVQLLDASSRRFYRRVALIFGAKKITYGELARSSRQLAAALVSLGVGKSDRVAVWLPNCPEFVYVFFAVLRLGGIVVPVNTMLKREEVKFIIDDCRAKTLVVSIDKLEDSKNIRSRSFSLKDLISLPSPTDDDSVIDFKKLIEQNQTFEDDVAIAGDDYAEIVYTSGTTGKPKGVCLSHRNLISNVESCVRAISFSRRDCLICILPLFHSFASTVCMLLPLYKGARIVLMRAVRPFKRIIRAIFKHRVTVFIAVPSLYNILAEMKLSRLQRIAAVFLNPIRLCISGAAALPGSVWEKFEKKFRRPLLQGYGLTEAAPVVSLNPLRGLRKPDSIGLPFESVEVKIVDSNGKVVPSGTVGELIVRGPNVMQGYYNLEKETAEVLKDGWLFTGDLARKDDNGFIYIMGRSKEMINVRGFNVYPREIEDLLYRYPYIKEAAVVGVLHRRRGEVPVAFVVAERQITQREIISYLRSNLAAYKVPLKVFFKDDLPKNATGKVLKYKLQAELEAEFS